jgi:hypothetical protein
MTKKMPSSAIISMDGEKPTISSRGGPRITPANSSPSMTGNPNLEKTIPNTQATVKIRSRFTMSSAVIATSPFVYLFMKGHPKLNVYRLIEPKVDGGVVIKGRTPVHIAKVLWTQKTISLDERAYNRKEIAPEAENTLR